MSKGRIIILDEQLLIDEFSTTQINLYLRMYMLAHAKLQDRKVLITSHGALILPGAGIAINGGSRVTSRFAAIKAILKHNLAQV